MSYENQELTEHLEEHKKHRCKLCEFCMAEVWNSLKEMSKS